MSGESGGVREGLALVRVLKFVLSRLYDFVPGRDGFWSRPYTGTWSDSQFKQCKNEGDGYYSMQASRWTAIAARPEVAAAQMEVASAPTKLEKMPPCLDWVAAEDG